MSRKPDTSRWPLYDSAIRAGRVHRAAGGERWWPELAPLSPKERGLVMRALEAEEQDGHPAELPSEAAARSVLVLANDTPPDAATITGDADGPQD